MFFTFTVIPDLTDVENIKMFLTWNGSVGGLNIIKKARITKNGLIKSQKQDDKNTIKDVEMI